MIEYKQMNVTYSWRKNKQMDVTDSWR